MVKNIMTILKRYPLSLLIIAAVIYLSFFKPPSPPKLDEIEGIDKVVHFCMYFGMSGMLWWEFVRGHRVKKAPLWHALIGAALCPIIFSGVIELLQEYCTATRTGDWWDFAANSAGAVVASVCGYTYYNKVIARG